MVWAYQWSPNKVKDTKPDMKDPKQGYNHAKFERPPLNSVYQKANVKAFAKS